MKFNVLRDGIVALCFLALLILIAMKVQADAARSLVGNFRAADGDSLALGEVRLRLLGIDAPELGQTCRRGGKDWRCGEASRQALAALVAEAGIDCRGDRTDKYRRLLVTCRQKGGVNINREMVMRGMAFAFGDYDGEEAQAREAKAGLWSGDFVRPTIWRRSHQAGMEPETPHVPSLLRRLLGLDQ